MQCISVHMVQMQRDACVVITVSWVACCKIIKGQNSECGLDMHIYVHIYICKYTTDLSQRKGHNERMCHQNFALKPEVFQEMGQMS